MTKTIQISDQAHAEIIKERARIQLQTGEKMTLSQTLDVILKVNSKKE